MATVVLVIRVIVLPMVAPLMTCSARLPVCLIDCSICSKSNVWGFFFLICKVWLFWFIYVGYCQCTCVSDRDEILQRDKSQHALLLELPSYRIPDLKSVGIGLLTAPKFS